MSPFVYSSDELGMRFIGKVLKAREVTAGEFDATQNATLSDKVGADQQVFFLMAENLEAAPGTFRSTFFLPDTRPVSKWGRFIRACGDLKIKIKRHSDGSTDLEGKYFIIEEKELQVGKYGTANTLELIGIPAPEEVEALESKRAAAVMPSGIDHNEVAKFILMLADGSLSSAQLEAQTIAANPAYKDAFSVVYKELVGKGSIKVNSEGNVVAV